MHVNSVLEKTGSSCKWDRVTLKKVESINNVSTSLRSGESGHDARSKDNENDEIKIEVSDFIVAVYDDICYIGQLLEFDTTDDSLHVNFMATSGKSELNRFKWPLKADQIWIEWENVLRKIDLPVAAGKGGRIFTVPDEVNSFMELK